MGWLSILPIILGLVDKFVPDKDAALRLKMAFNTEVVKGEFDNALAQVNVNQAEAQSGSLFIAGWRPFIGWVCATAFTYNFVVLPILQFIYIASGHPLTLPVFDINSVLGILGGMLGLGGLRTYEKVKGLDTTSIGRSRG